VVVPKVVVQNSDTTCLIAVESVEARSTGKTWMERKKKKKLILCKSSVHNCADVSVTHTTYDCV